MILIFHFCFYCNHSQNAEHITFLCRYCKYWKKWKVVYLVGAGGRGRKNFKTGVKYKLGFKENKTCFCMSYSFLVQEKCHLYLLEQTILKIITLIVHHSSTKTISYRLFPSFVNCIKIFDNMLIKDKIIRSTRPACIRCLGS